MKITKIYSWVKIYLQNGYLEFNLEIDNLEKVHRNFKSAMELT